MSRALWSPSPQPLSSAFYTGLSWIQQIYSSPARKASLGNCHHSLWELGVVLYLSPRSPYPLLFSQRTYCVFSAITLLEVSACTCTCHDLRAVMFILSFFNRWNWIWVQWERGGRGGGARAGRRAEVTVPPAPPCEEMCWRQKTPVVWRSLKLLRKCPDSLPSLSFERSL